MFFEKYLSKYNELYVDVSDKEFIDTAFKKKLFENYLKLYNQLLKEKKDNIMQNHEVNFYISLNSFILKFFSRIDIFMYFIVYQRNL